MLKLTLQRTPREVTGTWLSDATFPCTVALVVVMSVTVLLPSVGTLPAVINTDASP